jgi:hypothetical protein
MFGRYAGVVLAVVLCSVGCVTSASAQIVGPISWQSPVLVDHAQGLQAISCPAQSLCVATDSSGNVLTSANPTGGVRFWNAAHVDSRHGELCGAATCPQWLTSISCPSVALCVALDTEGYVFWTTDPLAGASAWSSAKIGKPNQRGNAVSCPSPSLCVVVEDTGEIAMSTDPTGGVGAWHTTKIDSGQVCRVNICASVGRGPAEPPLGAISCPSTSLCVAGDWDGNVLTSTDPIGGSDSWSSAYVDSNTSAGLHHGGIALQTTITSVACPSTSLCLASDEDGYVLASQNPAGGPSTWRSTLASRQQYGATAGSRPATGYLLFGLTCPSQSLCLALQGHAPLYSLGGMSASELYVTEDPLSGMPWTPGAIDPSGRLEAVSCPSAALCVAVDDAGAVLVGKAVTRAQIRALLRSAARPCRAPISSLLHSGACTVRFRAPLPGSVLIRWLASSTGRGIHAKPIRVAAGRYIFHTGGSKAVRLRLSRAGLALLRRRRHLRLTVQTTFTPLGGKPLTTTAGFAL